MYRALLNGFNVILNLIRKINLNQSQEAFDDNPNFFLKFDRDPCDYADNVVHVHVFDIGINTRF